MAAAFILAWLAAEFAHQADEAERLRKMSQERQV